MKVRLLKKLRKKYRLYERNSTYIIEYRDRGFKHQYYQYDLETAKQTVRNWILKDANNYYFKPKKRIL